MKSLPISRSVARGGGSWRAFSALAALRAQETAVVSAQPGQRIAQRLPAPDGGDSTSPSTRPSARARQQPGPERHRQRRGASQFFLFRTTASTTRCCGRSAPRRTRSCPRPRSCRARTVVKNDTSAAGPRCSQLTPWGGTFSPRDSAGDRTATNSSSSDVNPSFSAGLTASGQPAAAAQFRPDRDELADRHRAQRPRRVVPALRAQRSDDGRLRRAGVLGPRVRVRTTSRSSRRPRRSRSS